MLLCPLETKTSPNRTSASCALSPDVELTDMTAGVVVASCAGRVTLKRLGAYGGERSHRRGMGARGMGAVKETQGQQARRHQHRPAKASSHSRHGARACARRCCAVHIRRNTRIGVRVSSKGHRHPAPMDNFFLLLLKRPGGVHGRIETPPFRTTLISMCTHIIKTLTSK